MSLKKWWLPVAAFFILALFAVEPLLYAVPQEVDLVKLQKEEEERKKKTKKSKYVVTNDNLEELGDKEAKKKYSVVKVEASGFDSTPSLSEKNTGEADSGDGGGRNSDEKQNEAYWKAELSRIKGEISSLEKQIPELEAELSMFANAAPDDVYARQQVRVKKIKELEKAVKNAKARLATAKNELKNLHSRARKAGAPPGWLRQKKTYNKPKGGEKAGGDK